MAENVLKRAEGIELEHAIGVQLLRRTTRQLSLTEAGAVYFEQCQDIATTLEHAELAVHQCATTRAAGYG